MPSGPPAPTIVNGGGVDLSPRFVESASVVGSPADATETVIASVTVPANIVVNTGIELYGYACYTVGTSGVSGRLRIRRTSVAGATVLDTGALTVAATNLAAPSISGLDTGGTLPNQVYVLTLTVGSGAAASTVSAVYLRALVI